MQRVYDRRMVQATETREPLTKPVRFRPSTHIRLLGARIVDGETLDSVVNRALDALKKAHEQS